MKIGYCVITHINSPILRFTVEALHRTDPVFVHVDRKSDFTDYLEYEGKVHFAETRLDVGWGNFAQIECTLALFQAAVESGCDYACLISGDDLPLKSGEAIRAQFAEKAGSEFIGVMEDSPRIQALLRKRVRYRHLGFHYQKRPPRILEGLYEKTKWLLTNPLFDRLPPLYKGSQWLCLSRSFLDYVFDYLDRHPWYMEAFAHSLLADEMFFQTLVMNSPFRDRVYKLGEYSEDCHMGLRYIDWTVEPGPKILDHSDVDRIKRPRYGDCIFGRKFHPDTDLEEFNRHFEVLDGFDSWSSPVG